MGSKRARLSIALTTFNGSEYLAEQLSSFEKQTRRPDELVVCDDGSSDDTFDQLEAFARRAPFEIRIFRNSARIGPTENFARAIALCEGDLIALSDQDDVWCPEKLARMEYLILKDSLVGGVFCNALIVDERLRPCGLEMWDRVDLSGESRRQVEEGCALPVLLKRYRVQGATLMFQAKLTTTILPIPEGWSHDAWIAVVTASLFKLRGIPLCLQKYRQHGGNVVGAGSGGFLEKLQKGWTPTRATYYQAEITKYSVLLNRLRETTIVPDHAIQLISEKLRHLSARAAFPRGLVPRCTAIIREWRAGGYRRYATDWRSVLLDLFKR